MERDMFLQEVARMRRSFFTEEILDRKFLELEHLERLRHNPGYVENVYADYFINSSRFISLVEKELEDMPNKPVKVDEVLNQFRERSASVGARKVQSSINNFADCVARGNYLECTVAFRQMKRDFECLKSNLQTYFELVHRPPPVTARRDDSSDSH